MEENGTLGRCISCGFLAYRPGLARLGFEYQEVEPQERETPEKLYRPPKPKPKPFQRTESRFPGRPYSSPPPYSTDIFHDGYLVCFRRRADLPTEMKDRIGRDPSTWEASPGTENPTPVNIAVRGALEADRRCPEYFQYITGLTPKDHLMERRLLGLEEDRRAFHAALERQNVGVARQGRNLAIAAIIVGALIGGAQVLTMTSESVLYKFGAAVYRRFVPPPPPVPQTSPPPVGGV